MDGSGIVRLRLTCAQGCCFELAFDEGGREGGGRRFLYEGQCHRTLHFSSFRLLWPEWFGVEVDVCGGTEG